MPSARWWNAGSRKTSRLRPLIENKMSGRVAAIRPPVAGACPRSLQETPMRYLFMIRSCHQVMPPPELMTAMHDMAQAEVAAGRMIYDGGLMPRDAGFEVHIVEKKLRVMDGPFTETKEVIGGFA